jgi:hypothetical protein
MNDADFLDMPIGNEVNNQEGEYRADYRSKTRQQPIHFDNDLEDMLKEKDRLPVVKGCFIATAAMGSDLHPHVQLLREFRDNILLQSKYKNTFENLLEKYYLLSPPIARAMDKNLYLKSFLRYSLVYPIVYAIKVSLPIADAILGIKKDAKVREMLNADI